MKKINLKTFLIFAFISCTTMTLVSCGGGDDDVAGGDSTGRIVDGVYVPDGKKLTQLQLSGQNEYDSSEYLIKFDMKYDAKGRLTNISYYTDNYAITNLATIDYDLKTITLSNYVDSPYHSYSFSLNSEGYISKIGTCDIIYDANGYVYKVRDNKGISTLVFDSGDFIKAAVEPLISGNTKLYYAFYGNDSSTGDLYVSVSGNVNSYAYLDFKAVISLIAYQSGLFGKISRCITNLRENSSRAIGKYETNKNSRTYRFTFVSK